MWWLYPVVFATELIWSWVANRVNISVIKRKPLQAWLYGLACSIMSWVVPMIVYLWTEDWTYAVAGVLGDSLGDLLSALRPKEKEDLTHPHKLV